MTVEQNTEMALKYLRALGSRDIGAMGELFTEDATWWIIPGTKFSGRHHVKDFLSSLPLLFNRTVGPFEVEVIEVTAQDNRVSIIATGNIPLNDGGTYNSDYNFFFTFRDGKIASGREYLDGVLVNKVFGAPGE